MARDYVQEYARESALYRRLTVRLPIELAELFEAKCAADGIRPADWVRSRIFEEVQPQLRLGLVRYQGFDYDWQELVAAMDPLIYAELMERMPAETSNEEFLEEYGALDPEIYKLIDPFA